MLSNRFGLGRILVLTALVAAALARPVHAQTPEGTTITNTATVSFTDANSNTYSSVSASVSVTVGFAAGLDVTAASATATPAVPSTGNSLSFTVQNIGNGTDQVAISQSISVANVISVTGYVYNSTTYASLAALNTALAGANIAQGASIDVAVEYDVLAGTGGVSTILTLTATSNRDNGVSDAASTTITPAETIVVAVTPDGGQNVTRLPSNGTNYTATFTVTNNGNGPEDFDLGAAGGVNAALTIVSVNGVAGSTTQITGVTAGGSQSIDVVYSVGNVAAGTVDTVYLTATSVTDNGVDDQGAVDITVVRPALTVAKAAYRDDQTTLIGGSDEVLPGEFIQYRITVTNSGDAAASSVQIDDVLPGELTFISASGDLAGWTITNTGNTVEADLSGTLAAGASRYIWIRVQID